MKKILLWLCLLALVFSCVSCGAKDAPVEEESKLTILCEKSDEDYVKRIGECFEYLYGNLDLDIVVLATDPVERDAQAKSIKTEIISGGGPDIFVLGCEPFYLEENGGAACEPFFPNLNKNIAQNIFLPLDDYISESSNINIENYPPELMAAGRSDEGQEVLPILCTLSAVQYESSMFSESFKALYSLGEIFAGEAGQYGSLFALGDRADISNMNFAYTQIIDWENEKLLITEEELAEAMKEFSEFVSENKGNTGTISYSSFSVVDEDNLMYRELYEDEYELTGLTNETGGLTAVITDYVAVNRNTGSPNTAYKFAELFLCDAVQMNEGFYSESEGYNIYDTLRPSGFARITVHKFAYGDDEFSAEYIGKINSARFYTEVEDTLTKMWQEVRVQSLYGDIDAKSVAEDIYMKLRMILAE